jgi:hypothetical protein
MIGRGVRLSGNTFGIQGTLLTRDAYHRLKERVEVCPCNV